MRAPVAAGLVLAGTAHALPAVAQPCAPVRRLLGIADRLRDPGAVALTFDDGPHPAGTPAVLDALAAAGARATFFLVGEQVARDPGLAAAVAAAGHAVALHCDRHRNLLRLAPPAVHDDLLRAADRIARATGREPALHRAPYGTYSAHALRVVRARGWTPVLWSRWGRDWERRATPASVAALATRDLRGGEIVLLHDADHYGAAGSWERTAGALPAILAAIAERGLRPVALEPAALAR